MKGEEQLETPLYTALWEHIQKNYACLHVPAHRGGLFLPSCLKQEDFLKMDLTELSGLDNLHSPRGPIARAQEMAAKLYQARESFFLVNGSTVGVQALLAAVCRPGQKVIVARDSHRAVLSGLVFSGAVPVFVQPEQIKNFGLPAGIKLERLARVLKNENDIRGILLTYPNYYGVAACLEDLVELGHKAGQPFLVDEAHGAHLPFHPDLPGEALACGADAAVMSMHKTGGSLTQSSLLHINGSRLETERIQATLALLQTSSPSYLLMASLDLARRRLAIRGHVLLERCLELAQYVRMELEKIPGLKVLTEDDLENEFSLDYTRISINVKDLGLSGYQVAGLLTKKFGVNCEMADYYNVVAIVSIGVNVEDCRTLVHGLKEISRREAMPVKALPEIPALPVQPPGRMTPREAWFGPAKKIPLESSAGSICAEWVAAYPPGVPVIYPGEEITSEVIEYLQYLKNNSVPVVGTLDGALEEIRVAKES